MPDSPADIPAGADVAPLAGGSAPAFAELRRAPLVQALLAACGATACHLVGGALRDAALGLATHDLDAVVAGRGREIADDLATSLPARLVLLGGEEFAAYRLVVAAGDGLGLGGPAVAAHATPQAADPFAAAVHGTPYTASPAAASETQEAANPVAGAVLDIWDRQNASLHDDLARRDFTVNSFALEPREGAVVDPFGGLADLARRRLRATTERSFDGDPLRVLRLVRLLARLPGFSTDVATCELARRAAPRLPEMAADRIREELWLALAHAGAERALRALAALDLYPGLWLDTPGAPGGREGAAAAARAAVEIAALPTCAAELDRLMMSIASPNAAIARPDTTIAGPNAATSGPKAAAAKPDAAIAGPVAAATGPDARAGYPWPLIDLGAARFAATFRQLAAPPRPAAADQAESGAPEAALGSGTPAAAPGAGAPTAALARMQEAGYLAARHAAAVALLLAIPPELPATELDRRRFLHRYGRSWRTVACAIGAAAIAADPDREPAPTAAARWRLAAAPLCELAGREGSGLIAPPRLLDGNAVQRLLGIAAGPRVGEALAALTAAQVDGAVRGRDEAERFLRGWQREQRE